MSQSEMSFCMGSNPSLQLCCNNLLRTVKTCWVVSHNKMSCDSKGETCDFVLLTFLLKMHLTNVNLECSMCRLKNGPTQESIDQAADAPHGSEEDLWQLLQTWVQHHLMRDAAGAEKLLLELGSCAHYRRVAQIHRVTGNRGAMRCSFEIYLEAHRCDDVYVGIMFVKQYTKK